MNNFEFLTTHYSLFLTDFLANGYLRIIIGFCENGMFELLSCLQKRKKKLLYPEINNYSQQTILGIM